MLAAGTSKRQRLEGDVESVLQLSQVCVEFHFTEATRYLRRHQILLKSVMCDCDLEFMLEMNLMAHYIFMMSSLLFPPGRKRFSWRRRLFSGEIDC